MIRNPILFYMTAILSFIMAFMSYRFTTLGMDAAFPEMIGHLTNSKLILTAHVISAPLALFLGAMNMIDRRRKKRRVLHRWTGRAYGVSVLVGSVSGLVMAIGAEGGVKAGFGFGILAILWFVTTVQAIRFAVKRDFKSHRRWMIRSFALTLAAVTLRIYLPMFMILGEMSYMQASVWIAWLC